MYLYITGFVMYIIHIYMYLYITGFVMYIIHIYIYIRFVSIHASRNGKLGFDIVGWKGFQYASIII